jgi:hypothetical protein
MCQWYSNVQFNYVLCQLWWNPCQIFVCPCKNIFESFNNCFNSNTLLVSNFALIFIICVVLHQFSDWASSIVNLQLMSIQWSTIHVLWFLLEFHLLQHSLVDGCSMFLDMPYPPKVPICLFVLCISNSYFEIIVFTSISMISTSRVFNIELSQVNWLFLLRTILAL